MILCSFVHLSGVPLAVWCSRGIPARSPVPPSLLTAWRCESDSGEWWERRECWGGAWWELGGKRVTWRHDTSCLCDDGLRVTYPCQAPAQARALGLSNLKAEP